MLAGVSVDYYVRMERGSLAGASESVLDALASALQLDEAERDHLFALARESGTAGTRRKRPRRRRASGRRSSRCSTRSPTPPRGSATAATTSSPMNQLARALYAPVLGRSAATRRTPPASSTCTRAAAGVLRRLRPDRPRRRRDAPARGRPQPARQEAHRARSASCPPAASCSGSAGPRTTSASTAAAASACATRSSASSTSTSRPWSSRPSPGCSSTSRAESG